MCLHVHKCKCTLHFSDQVSQSFHFWIGLFLPQDIDTCECTANRLTNACRECREKFVWVDGTENVLNYWGYTADPRSDERCVRLRDMYQGAPSWAGTLCENTLKYICKSGFVL